MPVVFDPETPARLCRRGQHDLPDAEDFVYGTIYECDRPTCKARFKRMDDQRDGAYWAKHNVHPLGERQLPR